MFKYRDGINILEMLKKAGYNTNRIRQEKIFGQRVLQKFREKVLPSWNELNRICQLLSCEPWDIIEYVPDEETHLDKE